MRYPTAASIAKLAARFGLRNEPMMQDWEIEVADPDRVEEFAVAYEDPSFDDGDRFLLMALMLASMDMAIEKGRDVGATLSRVRAWMRHDVELHRPTLDYWARWEEPEAENWFHITQKVREILGSSELAPPE